MAELQKPYYESDNETITSFVMRPGVEAHEPLVNIFKIAGKCEVTDDYVLMNLMTGIEEILSLEDIQAHFSKVSEDNLQAAFIDIAEGNDVYRDYTIFDQLIKNL